MLGEVRTGWGPSSTRIMEVAVCLTHCSFLSSSNQQLGLEGAPLAWPQPSRILRPRPPALPPQPALSQGQAGYCLQPQQLPCAPFVPRGLLYVIPSGVCLSVHSN